MLKKLGIIKKIQLWIKGRNDAKSERFQEVVVTVHQQEEKMILPINIEETVLEKKEQFMMKWENKPNVDVNINLIWEEMNQYVENLLSEVTSQKFLVSKQKKIHISAFMLTELQEFKRERDYLISHKKFKIHKQESAPKKSFTFQKGINFLEKNLKDLNAQMFIKETEYKKRKEWLETELNKCKNGLISAHQLKEYEAEMEEVNRLYLKEQEESYMNAIFLIHEEIRIIEQMKVLLRLKKNYHFLCIRYYYQSAQMILRKLPLSELTDDILKEIGGLEELGADYEQILEKAHQMDREFKDRYVVSTIN